MYIGGLKFLYYSVVPYTVTGKNFWVIIECREGLGTAIFSYSMQCVPCMSSGLGWTLFVFLATFPTTILFLVVLVFQCHSITLVHCFHSPLSSDTDSLGFNAHITYHNQYSFWGCTMMVPERKLIPYPFK